MIEKRVGIVQVAFLILRAALVAEADLSDAGRQAGRKQQAEGQQQAEKPGGPENG